MDSRASAGCSLAPGRDDVSDFIAGFAGNDRYIVDYLVEEVLSINLTRFAVSFCTQVSTGSRGRSVKLSPAVMTVVTS